MLTRTLLIGVLASTISIAVQQPQRDVGARPTSGRSAIGGSVVAAADRQPLRRARVTLRGELLSSPLVTVTDDAGHFSFSSLGSGTYTLDGGKAGYITTAYGATRPGRPAVSIALADSQRTTDVVIALPRAAAISGAVRDERGAPLPNASVSVLRYRMRDGVKTLTDTYQSALTDDRGDYRLFGLDAGEYLVVMSRAELSRRGADFVPIAEGEVDLALRSRDAIGPPATPASTRATAPQPNGFAPVFYPGTTTSANAVSVTVAYGDERSGIDFALQLRPMARVDVTVTGTDGRPIANALVSVLPSGPQTEQTMAPYVPGGLLRARRSDGQGVVTYASVAPGDYVLSARASTPAPADPCWAESRLAIDGTNQAVALTMQPCVSVTGRVVFDGSSAPPANLANVRVMLQPTNPLPAELDQSPVPAAPVASDGMFRIDGLAPGQFRMTATVGGPSGSATWALQSASVNGHDALDVPFNLVAGAASSDAVVTFTDRPTELSGTLRTSSGAPMTDAVIIVFSADRTSWRPQSRSIAATRPSTSGAFAFRNLPPGEYVIAAVSDVEDGEWFDAAFLSEIAAASPIRVQLHAGEKKTQDLRPQGRLQ